MVLRTYCLACRKYADNFGSRNVLMASKDVVNVCLINQDL